MKWVGQWTDSLSDQGVFPFLIDESDDIMSYVNDPG